MLTLFQRCTICHQAGSIFCLQCQRHLNQYTHKHTHEDLGNLTGLVIGRNYDRIIRHLVHRLKYGKGKSIAQILGSKLATLIQTTDLIENIDKHQGNILITAVPTHRIKYYFTRGYNQAELLARSIAQSLNIPYSNLLYKSHRTTSQIKASRTKRLTNILNSFEHNNNNQISDPSVIILVDDIITTGSTIHECTRILHTKYPSSQIWGVCIARNK